MLNGTVSFVAAIRDNGLQFARFDFNPNLPGAEKVEIESSDGKQILSVVHLKNVADESDGQIIAEKAINDTLDRISYHYSLALENARITDKQFTPAQPSSNTSVNLTTHVHFQSVATVIRPISPAKLKSELEHSAWPGESNFGMFRSALRSVSPVEAFMWLYQILMMLFHDNQKHVDDFIMAQCPATPQTESRNRTKKKKKRKKLMETIYSRLRNELGHYRQAAIETTKLEMACWLNPLKALTKKAIELHS